MFLDVPCVGMWRDLEFLPGEDAASSVMSEEFANSFLQEGCHFSYMAEVGIFRDITIGAGRCRERGDCPRLPPRVGHEQGFASPI